MRYDGLKKLSCDDFRRLTGGKAEDIRTERSLG